MTTTLQHGQYTYRVGDIVIAYAGPRYGAAHEVVEIDGNTLRLRHLTTGRFITLPAHDCGQRNEKVSDAPH